jgi:hypothetical protein
MDWADEMADALTRELDWYPDSLEPGSAAAYLREHCIPVSRVKAFMQNVTDNKENLAEREYRLVQTVVDKLLEKP